MDSRDIADALTSPASTEGLHIQILGQIRDNLSSSNRRLDSISETLQAVNVRVVKLEERDERLDRAEKAIEVIGGKMDILLSDKQQREGVSKFMGGIKGWVPVVFQTLAYVFAIFGGVYLAGRATGLVSPPPGYVEPRRP